MQAPDNMANALALFLQRFILLKTKNIHFMQQLYGHSGCKTLMLLSQLI